MKPIVPLLLVIIILSGGCLVQSNTPGGEFLSALTCQQVAANAAEAMACIPTTDGLLLQAENGQITLRTETAVITFDSTIYLSHRATQMQLVVLDGVASISADNVTRVIRAGLGVELGANAALVTVGVPSLPAEPAPDTLIGLPISNLPRPLERQTVQVPVIPATATPAPTQAVPILAPTSTPDTSIQSALVDTTDPSAPIAPTSTPECTLPPGWDIVYQVQPGDTLTQISLEYNIGIAEIISANCITNPDRLALNQELRLPGGAPGEVTFTAERDVIVVGDCVTLNWSAFGATSVSLGGVAVASSGTQSVCPAQTQTYELIVVGLDGAQSTYSQTITVTQ